MYTRRDMLKSVKNWIWGILLRSQKYTGTDNLYIMRHGFWTAASYLATSILGIAAVWVYANIIPRELYGAYKYILALIGSLGFLTLTGMNRAVAQAVASGHEGVLPYSVRIQLRWNMLYTIAGLGMAGWYFWHGNAMFGWSIVILSLITPLTAAFNTYGAFLNGKKQFRSAGIYAFISQIFYIACILVAFLLSRNIVLWIIAYTLGGIIPCLFFYLRTVRNASSDITPDIKSGLIRFGGHLSFVNILSTISGYIDNILLFQYVGPAAVSIYAFASVGVDRAGGLLKNVSSILMPRLVERSLAEIDQVFYRRTFQAMAIGLIASIGYILLAPPVFHLLLPKYLDALRYSQVLSLSMIGVLAGGYMGNAFNAHRMLRAIYASSVGVNILRITLFVVLGYFWGVWGMIIATLATQAIGIPYNFVLWELAMHRANLRPRER
jgi:O-antigen/teichoic acid export membrane protein